MSDRQLAEISEIAARYFKGWKPKPIGERIEQLETAVRWALGEEPRGAPDFCQEHAAELDAQGLPESIRSKRRPFWWRTTLRRLAGM